MKENDRLLPIFLNACLCANMFKQLSMMYEEAHANGWPIHVNTVNLVIKAMHAQGCSRTELLAFYKTWVEKTGLVLEWPTVIILLNSGVSIKEIRNLEYRDPLLIDKCLIRALAELGRKNESREIVLDILERQERRIYMPIFKFLSVVKALVRSGFQAEAQSLADQQERLGLRLDGALSLLLKTAAKPVVGLEAYQALEAIHGSHRQSLAVQALLIRRCYEDPSLTTPMYQASHILKIPGPKLSKGL